MISKFTELEKTLGNGHRPYRYRLQINFPKDIFSDGDNIVNTLVKATTIPGVRIQQRNFYNKGHLIPLTGIKVYDQEWSATFYLDDNFKMRRILDSWVQIQDSTYSGLTDVKDGGGIEGLGGTLMSAGLSMVSKGVDSLVSSVMGAVTPSVAGAVKSLGVPLGDTFLELVSPSASSAIAGAMKKTQTFLQDTADESLDGTNLYGEVVITALDIDDSEEIISYTLHNAFPISIQQVSLDDSMTNNISEFTCSFAFSHYTLSKPASIAGDAIGGTVGGIIKGIGL